MFVLIIDDSPTIQCILVSSLQRVGVSARPFPDGLQALQALTSHQIPWPDVVVLDLMLPHMDGYAVARALRKHARERATPIIMLSGHTGRWARLQARFAGASEYIPKPFKVAELVACILSRVGGTGERQPSPERQRGPFPSAIKEVSTWRTPPSVN